MCLWLLSSVLVALMRSTCARKSSLITSRHTGYGGWPWTDAITSSLLKPQWRSQPEWVLLKSWNVSSTTLRTRMSLSARWSWKPSRSSLTSWELLISTRVSNRNSWTASSGPSMNKLQKILRPCLMGSALSSTRLDQEPNPTSGRSQVSSNGD